MANPAYFLQHRRPAAVHARGVHADEQRRAVPQLAQLHAHPADDQHVVQRQRANHPSGLCDERVQPIHVARGAWHQRPLLFRRLWRRLLGLQDLPLLPRIVYVCVISACEQIQAQVQVAHHITTFSQVPGYQRRRHDEPQPRGCGEPLRRGLLEPFSTPDLPGRRGNHLPPAPR